MGYYSDTGTVTYDLRELYTAIASEPLMEYGQFLRTVTKKAVIEGHKSAVFDIPTAITTSTAALGETADGNAQVLAATQVTIPVAEYGERFHLSGKYRATAYDDTVANAMQRLGENVVDKFDLLVRTAMDAQTGAAYNGYITGSAKASLDKNDELTSSWVRKAYAKLRRSKVRPFEGGYFLAFIHPDVMKDLKDETGNDSWTVKALYEGNLSDTIYEEAGIFEGFRFIVTSNCYLGAKAGGGTTTTGASCDVYTTYFVGTDAIGQAVAQEPRFGQSYPTGAGSYGDAYGRHTHINWYAMTGFKAIRAACLYKVHSSSSMTANGT